MKKLASAAFAAIVSFSGAYASDGGVYMETSNVYSGTARRARAQTTSTTVDTRPAARRVVVGRRPCPCNRATVVGAPVAVKTHTEITEHYQVYQPVVEYVPAGTYTRRHVVDNVRPCDAQ